MTAQATPVRVVVVSADTAQHGELKRILHDGTGITMVGHARGADDALALVTQSRPGVVILDLQHNENDRNTIETLMAHAPTPILVLSARIDGRESPTAVDALVCGALEALPRPARWGPEAEAQLCATVVKISKVHVIRHPRGNRTTRRPRPPVSTGHPVVAIAASTGGPSALASLLAGLGELPASVLIVQHLHPDFTGGLLNWMTRVSALPVEMASHGLSLRPRCVYLAPAGTHLRLGLDRRLELHTEPQSLHRPSADQLFESVAALGGKAIGVLLTGMGEDGARGLLAIHRNGGQTLAQDEATCAVYGMPRAAKRLGAVRNLLPLNQLAAAIQRAVAGIAP
jgi:two-component system chemotaxis response regulator CheB